MNNSDFITVISSLVSGVLGGVVVALVNHFLTRRKTEAEIKKLEAEAEKIKAETNNLSATVQYQLSSTKERVIYDSVQFGEPYDFKGVESQMWNLEENRHMGETGLGELNIETGKDGIVLNVERKNTGGRYEIWLYKYRYDNQEKEYIPSNHLISGTRKIHVSCQVKAVNGEHTIIFILRDKETRHWLASNKITTKGNEWTTIDRYFQIPPTADVHFRIDLQEPSTVPSSVQIRKLIIAEKVTE